MCLFCEIQKESSRFLFENELFFALLDQFPVSLGHALIIPKRHTPHYFELTKEEVLASYEAIQSVKKILDETYHPDGYNIGMNAGASAGQTIFHLHIHLIPRYEGDVENPRGGVRGVIPGKQNY